MDVAIWSFTVADVCTLYETPVIFLFPAPVSFRQIPVDLLDLAVT